MSKLKLVGMVRIDGQWKRQDEVEPELFRRLHMEQIDYAMSNQGFVRKDKTA